MYRNEDEDNVQGMRSTSPAIGPPHGLNESFTGHKPHGFEFEGGPYTSITSWRGLYSAICSILARRDPGRFMALIREYPAGSRKTRKDITTNSVDLYETISIGVEIEGMQIYAEGTRNAEQFREQLRILLDWFGIDHSSLIIYWREGSGPNDPPAPQDIRSIKKYLVAKIAERLRGEVESAGLYNTPLQAAIPAWAETIVERALTITPSSPEQNIRPPIIARFAYDEADPNSSGRGGTDYNFEEAL